MQGNSLALDIVQALQVVEPEGMSMEKLRKDLGVEGIHPDSGS
jgi:hypothetical protein